MLCFQNVPMVVLRAGPFYDSSIQLSRALYTRVLDLYIYIVFCFVISLGFNSFAGIEVTIFTVLGLRILSLDSPYLVLLGPLLAYPASGSTPSTRGNPVAIHVAVKGPIYKGSRFIQFFALKNLTYFWFYVISKCFMGMKVTILMRFKLRFLSLDAPCLALLGPLLASQGSDSTPSTRGNPDRTPKIIKIN